MHDSLRSFFLSVLVSLTLCVGALAEWSTDYPSALRSWSGSGRALVVFLTAEWCGPCQKLKGESFSSSRVRSLLSGMVAVMLEDTNPHFRTVVASYFGNGNFGTPTVLVFSPGSGTPGAPRTFSGFRPEAEVYEFLRPYAARREAAPRPPEGQPRGLFEGFESSRRDPAPRSNPVPGFANGRSGSSGRGYSLGAASSFAWKTEQELTTIYEKYGTGDLPAPIVFYLNHDAECESCRAWRDQNLNTPDFRQAMSGVLAAISVDTESEFGQAFMAQLRGKVPEGVKRPLFVLVKAGVPGDKQSARSGRWNPKVYQPRAEADGGLRRFLQDLEAEPKLSPRREERGREDYEPEVPTFARSEAAPERPKGRFASNSSRSQPESSSNDSSAWHRHAPEHALRHMPPLRERELESFLRQVVGQVRVMPNGKYRSQGTAFLINFTEDEGAAMLITNHHVVASGAGEEFDGSNIPGHLKFQVVFQGNVVCDAKLAYTSRRADLAVLGIRSSCLKDPAGTPIVPTARDWRAGERTFALGFPGEDGDAGQFITGRIGSDVEHIDDEHGAYKVIEAAMRVEPGVSGAPVLNEFGHLIGVVHARPSGKNADLNKTYMIHVAEVKKLLHDFVADAEMRTRR